MHNMKSLCNALSSGWTPSTPAGLVSYPKPIAELVAAGKLWQDTGKTVPAVVATDPVRVMTVGAVDYIAPSTSARPVLRDEAGGKKSLVLDGIDDTLEATVAWTGAYTISVVLRVTSAANFGMVCVLNNTNVELRCSGTTGRPQLLIDSAQNITLTTSIVGIDTVLTARHKVSTGVAVLQSSAAGESGTSTVPGTDVVDRIRIGSRVGGTFFMPMRMYCSPAVYSRSLSAADVALLQAYLLTLKP